MNCVHIFCILHLLYHRLDNGVMVIHQNHLAKPHGPWGVITMVQPRVYVKMCIQYNSIFVYTLLVSWVQIYGRGVFELWYYPPCERQQLVSDLLISIQFNFSNRERWTLMMQNLNACNNLVIIVVVDAPFDAKMSTAFIIGCSIEQPCKEVMLQGFSFTCIVNSTRDAHGSRCVMFCCGLVPVNCTHMLQDYFTRPMQILRFPRICETILKNMGK